MTPARRGKQEDRFGRPSRGLPRDRSGACRSGGSGVQLAIATLVVASAGCVSAWTPDFESPNPPDQTAAIIAAVHRYRPVDTNSAAEAWSPPWDSAAFRRDVAWLVVMLQSDDPGVRLLAIESLDRLVGERLGYEASAPWSERAVAIETWANLLHDRGYVGDAPLPPAGLLPPARDDADA